MRRLAEFGEIQPAGGGDLGILGTRRLAQHGLGLGGVTRNAQPFRERDSENLGDRSARERRPQDFERPVRLPLLVVEVDRTRHHVQVGRVRGQTRGPGFAHLFEVSALLLEGRRGGTVPGEEILAGPELDQQATRLRERLAGFLEPVEAEEGELLTI